MRNRNRNRSRFPPAPPAPFPSPLYPLLLLGLCAACLPAAEPGRPTPPELQGWLRWRGPLQCGVSLEKNLPERWNPEGGENHLWTRPYPGRGCPVLAGDRLYTLGYNGEGADLQEFLACLDARTGEKLWERRYSDYLSDIIYERYSIGSPALDPETGNLYILTSPGLFVCLDREGKELWNHELTSEFGRLTFPNGRTGAPVVDGDLVLVRGITAFWGNQGPAQDRFYAFDKRTGEHLWASAPGIAPKDSSFSTPLFAWWNGLRVFYCGTGCGNLVCVNARTGEPLWRFPFSLGGVNASLLLHQGDKLIAVHNEENIDSSETGRLAAIRIPKSLPDGPRPAVLPKDSEIWRADLTASTSSPVLVGDRIYLTTQTGVLGCLNAADGKVLWRQKLGTEQIHASPVYGDGKLYIPLSSGDFLIVRPKEEGPEILCQVKLAGNCLGAPAIFNGRVYLQTTQQLYCLGSKEGGSPVPDDSFRKDWEQIRQLPAQGLQVVPSELLLLPGQRQQVRFRWSNGEWLAKPPEGRWESFIPPTAKVQARLSGAFEATDLFQAAQENLPSAGMFKFTAANGKDTCFLRGRIVQGLPIREDFEAFPLKAEVPGGPLFAYPPLPWIGARFKWEVGDLGGGKVLAKTLDRILFQRSMSFIGHPQMKNYTVEADVMSEGKQRGSQVMNMGSVGVINQRYIISLVGSGLYQGKGTQILEVISNHDRIKVAVPFPWQPNLWYRLKARVDVAPDGSGTIRGKAWPRGEAEPAAWTIEVPHRNAHASGSPGLYGFSPQSRKKVFIDNVAVTANE